MRILSTTAASLALVAASSADVAAQEEYSASAARALIPLSQEALTEVGPIILNGNNVIFANGSVLQVSKIPVGEGIKAEDASTLDDEAGASVEGAQIYRIADSSSQQPLPGSPCGGADITHLVAVDWLSEGHEFVEVLFQAGSAIEKPCAGYLYSRGAEPEATVSGDAWSGKWELHERQNPEGGQDVIIALEAEEPPIEGADKVTFVARCISNKTDAFLHFGGEELNDDAIMNVVSLPGKEPKVRFWPMGDDKTLAVVPGWAGEFLKEIVSKERMEMSITAYGRGIDVSFDLRGMDPVLKKLSDSCNWSY